MSGERLPMRKIREVLRLRLDQGLNSVLIRLTQCEIRQRPERADPEPANAQQSPEIGGGRRVGVPEKPRDNPMHRLPGLRVTR